MSNLIYQLDSDSIVVKFPAIPNSLLPKNFSLSLISAPSWGSITPSVSYVEKVDNSNVKFKVVFDKPFTYLATYSMGVSNVTYKDGSSFTPFSRNFKSNFFDPATPLYACFSKRKYVDIAFNRDIGPTTTFAEATLSASGGSSKIYFMNWDSSLPTNVVRFYIPSSPNSDDGIYDISFDGIMDQSMNLASGNISISHKMHPPHTFSGISQLHIIDGKILGTRVDYKNESILRVYFSGPVNTSSSIISSFQVKELSPHYGVDNINSIISPAPNDISSLISFALILKQNFNSHISLSGVHDISRPLDLSDAINLSKDLKSKLIQHSSSVFHVDGSPVISFLTSDPTNLSELINLTNEIKSKFISHFTSGLHTSIIGPEWQSFSSDATDLFTCSLILDQAKTFLSLHSSNEFHSGNPGNASNIPYLNNSITALDPTSQISASFVVEEVSHKIISHFSDTKMHVHSDVANSFARPQVRSTNLSILISACQSITSGFNNHVSNSNDVPIIGISNNISSSPSNPMPLSPYCFFVDLIIKSDPRKNLYKVFCTLLSEDGASSTNTLDYTGSFDIPGIDSNPSESWSYSIPDGKSIISLNQSIDNVSFLSLTSDTRIPQVFNLRKRSSLVNLCDKLKDLCEFYNSHLIEAGHEIDLSASQISLSSFSYSLSWMITTARNLQDSLQSHLSNISSHLIDKADDFPRMSLMDELSVESFIQLAFKSIELHNLDESLHSFSSPFKSLNLGYDEFEIFADGWKNGELLKIEANLIRKDKISKFISSFKGKSNPPSLVSIVSIPGTEVINSNKLHSDYLDFILSRPCMSSINSSNVDVISGSVSVNSLRWVNSNTIRANVVGLRQTSYTMDLNNIYDKFGNSIFSGSSIRNIPFNKITKVLISDSQFSSSTIIKTLTSNPHLESPLSSSAVFSFEVDSYSGIGIKYSSNFGSVITVYDSHFRRIASLNSSSTSSIFFFIGNPGVYYAEIGSNQNVDASINVFNTSSDFIEVPLIDTPFFVGPGDVSVFDTSKYATFVSSLFDGSPIDIDVTPDIPLLVNIREGFKNGFIIQQISCPPNTTTISNFTPNPVIHFIEIISTSGHVSGKFTLALS